ncbi:MAG: glucose-6-phosphate isomerase, partial [Phycisphaerae bacterium]
EAGKKAAGVVIALQRKVLEHLRAGYKGSASQIAQTLNVGDEGETVHHTLRHLAANPEHKVKATDDQVLDLIYSIA